MEKLSSGVKARILQKLLDSGMVTGRFPKSHRALRSVSGAAGEGAKQGTKGLLLGGLLGSGAGFATDIVKAMKNVPVDRGDELLGTFLGGLAGAGVGGVLGTARGAYKGGRASLKGSSGIPFKMTRKGKYTAGGIGAGATGLGGLAALLASRK